MGRRMNGSEIDVSESPGSFPCDAGPPGVDPRAAFAPCPFTGLRRSRSEPQPAACPALRPTPILPRPPCHPRSSRPRAARPCFRA